MVNEHFHNDIHSLSPISPEGPECGEINISIASMMGIDGFECACVSMNSVYI